MGRGLVLLADRVLAQDLIEERERRSMVGVGFVKIALRWDIFLPGLGFDVVLSYSL